MHSLFKCAALLLAFALLCTACSGPTPKEQETRKQAERKEKLQRKQDADNKMIDILTEKFGAAYFPPSTIHESSLTYEFQQFFASHLNANILFRGYIEDIEIHGKGMVADFLCPISKGYLSNAVAVRFRLAIPNSLESTLLQIAQKKRGDQSFLSHRFLSDPDCYVSANVTDLQKVERTEIAGSVYSEQSTARITTPLIRVAKGKMIEIWGYETENETNK